MGYRLQRDSLAKNGSWQRHLISGAKFALFTCPGCCRIVRVGDLSRIAADGRFPPRFVCGACAFESDLIFEGW